VRHCADAEPIQAWMSGSPDGMPPGLLHSRVIGSGAVTTGAVTSVACKAIS